MSAIVFKLSCGAIAKPDFQPSPGVNGLWTETIGRIDLDEPVRSLVSGSAWSIRLTLASQVDVSRIPLPHRGSREASLNCRGPDTEEGPTGPEISHEPSFCSRRLTRMSAVPDWLSVRTSTLLSFTGAKTRD